MLIMSVNGGFSTVQKQSGLRVRNIRMDETILKNTLEGTLEEEGLNNHWLSEVGWASYLDK
jgi:hypothetical protein